MENKNRIPSENEKQLALKYLKETVAKIPPTLIIQPEIIIGSKILTPDQIIRAMEVDSEEGNLIIAAINGYVQEFKRSV
jgi:hypothetical protein